MAHKRQIDQLPIIPKDAKELNVVCHYCIVGCGYKAYTWPTNKQGGTAPGENKFGVDLSKQQPAETAAWYSPSMYNIVKQNGEDVHIVIKPDKDCVVNSGLGSVRGARMAAMSYSRQRNTQSTPDRSDGLALRTDAADQLGRRARSCRARHCRRYQRYGRGRPNRLRVRPWRRRRRLREYLGHCQTLLRRHEG